jgi:hypothetical protein
MFVRFANYLASKTPIFIALEVELIDTIDATETLLEGVDEVYDYVLSVNQPNGTTKKVERMLNAVLDKFAGVEEVEAS